MVENDYRDKLEKEWLEIPMVDDESGMLKKKNS